MTQPIRIAVTGAGGQIGYATIFRLASGAVFGPDQPVSLSLLEITPALPALQGTIMELDDCAFPLLTEVKASDKATEAFEGALAHDRQRTSAATALIFVRPSGSAGDQPSLGQVLGFAVRSPNSSSTNHTTTILT